MAGIHIVDAWLRSPMAYPTHQRALMVVAEVWSEQRVLMRAYADCPDQTQPSIVLHGSRLAIGPASLDPHGAWGIHVDRPVDGRAQELKGQLELAARRLSSYLRSVAENADASSARAEPAHQAQQAAAAMPAPGSAHGHWRSQPGAQAGYAGYHGSPGSTPNPGYRPYASAGYEPRSTPPLQQGWLQAGSGQPTGVPGSLPAAGWQPASAYGQPAIATPPGRPDAANSRGNTIRGYALGPGAQRGAGPGAGYPGNPGSMWQSVPRGLPLTAEEHRVLDALDAAGSLSAGRVAQITGAPDGAMWMRSFMARLTAWGVDVIAGGGNPGSEPVYVRKR